MDVSNNVLLGMRSTISRADEMLEIFKNNFQLIVFKR